MDYAKQILCLELVTLVQVLVFKLVWECNQLLESQDILDLIVTKLSPKCKIRPYDETVALNF